jgi:nucleotide sugar dehydrogenase
MNITVVGLGKIGLPLAVQFALKGHTVFGVDINEKTVELINRGVEPFPGELNLEQNLKKVTSNNQLLAMTDTVLATSQSDAVVVIVPLMVHDKGIPDFEMIDSATKLIAKGLRPGMLVSFETTVPIGSTRNRFAPILEEISGLKAGVDFDLVFSPERVFSGRIFTDLRKYPKLVGGISPRSSQKGVEFYSQVLDFDDRGDLIEGNGVWNMGSCEASEFAKLAETTYRDVNIALANQFALFAEKIGIDFRRVISASNSQPFSHIHNPGVAVGGHCIPIYPQFYLWSDPEASLVQCARSFNSSMPHRVVVLLEELHGKLHGQRVAVLGAAYRGGVKETAFSGVFPLVAKLEDVGAKVYVHDPLYSSEELENLGFTPYSYGMPIDAAIVQADHLEYSQLSPCNLPEIKSILDGRDILRTESWGSIKLRKFGGT